MTDLFTPLRLGPLQLPNRVLMAPLTRCRAEEGHVPGPLMATHYAQRASAGLLIAEATMAMEGNSAFWREPGIHSPAQVEGWRGVTEAVHRAGGRIVLQIWHGGRACHPLLNNGRQPVAPSPLAIRDDTVRTPEGPQPYVQPRELADDELPGIVEGFRLAARNAIAAGFDGVEVHGANGYLLDSFLRDGSNQRPGPYGGAIPGRARMLLEVLEAVRPETPLMGKYCVMRRTIGCRFCIRTRQIDFDCRKMFGNWSQHMCSLRIIVNAEAPNADNNVCTNV